MSQFINARSDLVDEALFSALILNENVSLLRGARVLVARSASKAQVAIVSGGGSGHEPAHGGFVGSLLTGAVCGDVFASPSVAQITALLDHLHENGVPAVLLVVKNYTGDRLNFGIAIERAKLPCEIVVVDDDITPLARPRGLAGTLFVHKVSHFWASSGASLPDIARECSAVIDR